LETSHRETTVYEDGRIIRSHFEISRDNFVTFISVYGVPQSTDNRILQSQQNIDKNKTLNMMKNIQKQIRTLTNNARRNNDLIFIFGDLQDTPDNIKLLLWIMQNHKTSLQYCHHL